MTVGLLTMTPTAYAATTPSPSPSADGSHIEATIPILNSTGNKLSFNLSAIRTTATSETPVPVDSVSIRAGLDTPNQAIAANFSKQFSGQAAIVLALDVSGSMTNSDLLQPEKDAAKDFIDQVKDTGIAVGIVTFGDKAELIVQPRSTDLDEIKTTIDALQAKDQKTAMFAAVKRAADALRQISGSRSILMISDGFNDGPNKVAARSQAQQSLGSGPVNRIDFTGILLGGSPEKQDIYDIDQKSSVRPTSNNRDEIKAELGSVITDSRQRITEAVSVNATVPQEWLGKAVELNIGGVSGGVSFVKPTFSHTFTAAALATTEAAAPVPLPLSAATSIPTGVYIAALVAVFAALAILLTSATGALAGADNKKSAVIRRLELYTVTGGKPARVEVTEQTTRLGDSALTRSAVNLMTRLARKSRMDDALDGQLEAAGLPIRTAEWMLLHIGIAVLSAVVLYAIGGGQIAAGVVGLLLGIAGPWIFLTFARSRRESKFLAQLPDTLQLLAGSLAAGYSLPQAMDSVVRESHPPISMEFNRALVEARLGMLAEDALDGIAKRTGSTDFSWIVMAIRIQRDVGGNLAELLSSVADTLRERERLRRQVDALSAEGRLSGAILGALPLVFGLYLMLTRPEYIAPLFDTRLGLLLLAVGGVMLIVGGFWMSRVIKVKV